MTSTHEENEQTKECPHCMSEIPLQASKCSKCGETLVRQVSVGLIIGIVLFPFVFSWFTLRKGHSTASRVASFVWLFIALVIAFSSRDEQGTSYKSSTKTSIDRTETEKSSVNLPTLPESENKVSISDLESKTGKFGLAVITGVATNNTDKQFSYVQVEINLYDRSGMQVGSTMANVNNLEPHGKWRFEAPLIEEKAASFKVKGVTAF
jgi:ribosomal protein L40E